MSEAETNPTRVERSSLLVAFAAGLVVVAIFAAGLVLLTRITQSHGRAATAHKMPFGPAEQTYALQIHFQGGQMSRASNLLNQEFTYVTGTVTNDGLQSVMGMDVIFEFHDRFNQVVLRDTQHLIDPKDEPLGAGKSRDFQVTLGEHIPSQWNQQYPSIGVTGLILE
jgi:hypothetical protein